EVEGAAILAQLTGPYSNDRRLDLRDCAAEPLTLGSLESVDPEHAMDIVVGEDCTITPHRGFVEHNPVGEPARTQRWVLLRDAGRRVYGRVADLEEARVLRIGVLVGVDRGARLRP